MNKKLFWQVCFVLYLLLYKHKKTIWVYGPVWGWKKIIPGL